MHRRQRQWSSARGLGWSAAAVHPLVEPPHPWACPRRRRVVDTPARVRGVAAGRGAHVRSDDVARVEAALFLAREPLSPRRLARLAGLADASRTRAIVKELRRLHDAAGTAFRVEQIAGGFQMLTRAPLGPWVRRLFDRPSAARLSAAAVETLAVVAYRQPVTRAEIEAIRGVGSEEIIRQLLERDLVAVGGRADDLGRPNVYVTTRRFLAAFGLARLADLPAVDLPAGTPPPPDDALAGDDGPTP
jgi:segregation and condensation protein B